MFKKDEKTKFNIDKFISYDLQDYLSEEEFIAINNLYKNKNSELQVIINLHRTNFHLTNFLKSIKLVISQQHNKINFFSSKNIEYNGQSPPQRDSKEFFTKSAKDVQQPKKLSILTSENNESFAFYVEEEQSLPPQDDISQLQSP